MAPPQRHGTQKHNETQFQRRPNRPESKSSLPPPPLPSNPKPKPPLPLNPKPSLYSPSPIGDASDSEEFNWDDYFNQPDENSETNSEARSKGFFDETPMAAISSESEEEKEETPRESPAILKDDWEHVQPAKRLADQEKKMKKKAANPTKQTTNAIAKNTKKKVEIEDPWKDDSDETPTKRNSMANSTRRQSMNQRMNERNRNESKSNYSKSPLSSSSSKITAKPSNQKPPISKDEDDWANDSDETPIGTPVVSSKSMNPSNRHPKEDDWANDSDDSCLPVEAPVSKSVKPSTRRQSMNERMNPKLTGRYHNEAVSAKPTAKPSNRKPNDDDWGENENVNSNDETPTSRNSMKNSTRRQLMSQRLNERNRNESKSNHSPSASSKKSNRKPKEDDWGENDSEETPISPPVVSSKSVKSSNRKPNKDDWGESDSDDSSLPVEAPPSKLASHSTRRQSMNQRINPSRNVNASSQSAPFTRKPEVTEWLESDEMPIETMHTPLHGSSNEFDFFASPPRSHRSSQSLSLRDRVNQNLASIPDFDFLSQPDCNPPFFSL